MAKSSYESSPLQIHHEIEVGEGEEGKKNPS
jgi:hypothetical protein